MKSLAKAYAYFVSGTLGGLIGWFLGAMATANMAPGLGLRIVIGAALGGAIGVALGVQDGIGTRSVGRAVRFGLVGLTFGTLAGAVALPLAQAVYGRMLGATGGPVEIASTARAFVAGAFCWMVFGGMLGLGEGVAKGSQATKGMIGGLLGGLLGGAVFEIARLAGVTAGATAEQFLQALTLMFVGGSVGASIAFVTTATRRAWFEVVDGELAGRIYDVTKYVDEQLGTRKPGVIGSDEWEANVFLRGDEEVLARHALIGFRDGRPTLSAVDETPDRLPIVNGRSTMAAPLRDGDRVQVGATLLLFHQKKRGPRTHSASAGLKQAS